jgi:hypothetical protein
MVGRCITHDGYEKQTQNFNRKTSKEKLPLTHKYELEHHTEINIRYVSS